MITDAPPRNANHAGFLESDRIRTLDLPQNGRLPAIAKSIESDMKTGKTADVRRACTAFLEETAKFYGTPTCGVRVLAARPLRVREHGTTELFGDYNPEAMLIRLWMRTAVRKEITSFGTFLSVVFGRAAPVTDAEEKRKALMALIGRFCGDSTQQTERALAQCGPETVVIRIDVERITGKAHRRKPS